MKHIRIQALVTYALVAPLMISACSNRANLVPHIDAAAIEQSRRLTGERLYADGSPLNTPIATEASVDPRSDVMVAKLVALSKERPLQLAVNDWTVPVYEAIDDTPRVDIAVAGKPPGANLDTDFVHDVESVFRDVPIPSGARPDPKQDAHLTIIDRSTGCEFDLYGAARTSTGWTALWANATPLDGSGIYPNGLSSRATGFAGAAGLVWPHELHQGHIDHALVFAYPFTKAGGPVSPATAADGRTNSEDAIPQGARIQLDPDLDLDTLELTPYEHTIARALQQYGMYVADTGGAPAVYAAGAQSFAGDAYEGLLPPSIDVDLSGIPLEKLRVLQTGPQQPVTPLRVVPTECTVSR